MIRKNAGQADTAGELVDFESLERAERTAAGPPDAVADLGDILETGLTALPGWARQRFRQLAAGVDVALSYDRLLCALENLERFRRYLAKRDTGDRTGAREHAIQTYVDVWWILERVSEAAEFELGHLERPAREPSRARRRAAHALAAVAWSSNAARRRYLALLRDIDAEAAEALEAATTEVARERARQVAIDRARAPAAHRIGFMRGELAVPDDFDVLGRDAIESAFASDT